ncbi:acyl-CoA dehydrogenase family protein [Dyella tabacisoli]|nr:acyl-CoA dehydrogenase family protein [Dyella tabacisoli]
MNFDADPQDEAFRTEVRRFIAALSPEIVRGKPLGYTHSRPEREAWIRALNAQGWLVPHWSRAWGGRDWTAMRRHILHDETCAAGCPEVDRIATDLVGPIIQAFGSAAQQRRYLPGILSGTEFWCQGFSEPQAGSDLSLVGTVARREGERYIVSGRKLWTTQAHLADLMFALVRVKIGNELQQGLSFLLVDMRAGGISTRPVLTLDGGHHVNEVLLEEVSVPRENLIGAEGQGWTYVRALLESERSSAAGIPHTKRDLRRLEEFASSELRHGRTMMDDPVFRAKLEQLRDELHALEFLHLRVLSATERGPRAEALGCVLKFRGAQAYQRVSELMLETLGERSIEYVPDSQRSADEAGVAAAYLFRRSATIAAGTTEIQKNMIAALALEL